MLPHPFLLLWAYSTSVALGVVETMMKDDAIKITLVSVFTDRIKIEWHSDIKHSIDKCEFSVHSTDKGSAIVNVMNVGQGLVNKEVEITGLSTLTSYTVFGICFSGDHMTYSSNHIDFTTTEKGSYSMTDRRHMTTHTSANSSPGVYIQKQPMGSPVDVVLGILFALMGLVIVLIGAIYFWKKVQARRRVQLFLRHEDSDSFPELRDGDTTSSESPTSLRLSPTSMRTPSPESML